MSTKAAPEGGGGQAPAPPVHCSLRKCIQGGLAAGAPHVEVKTFDITAPETEHMETAWREDGEAAFHDICWKALVDSYKHDNPFTLSPQEKELVQEARRTAEFFDSRSKVQLEGERIARMLKRASYAIAFTGAGISTSAGVGDFRGKTGQWTERDRAKRRGKHQRPRDFCYESLRPTYTHEALCRLLEMGVLRHVISQNTDGLHRLSGIPRDKLSELHGNSFHEKCERCATRWERPYAMLRAPGSKVQPRICVHCNFDHRTGRVCEKKGCDGILMNTIINFGDSLEKKVLSLADEHAKRTDLVLCLGSSLMVTPACDLVEMGTDPLRLVICNRQPTPFDKLCYLSAPQCPQLGARVFADCDALMRQVMKWMLAPEDLQEWESACTDRLQEYAKQRQMLV